MKCNLALYLRDEQLMLFVFRKMQEGYHANENKLYMCFVDLEKAFDRVPWKVLGLALKKKRIPEFWFDQSQSRF